MESLAEFAERLSRDVKCYYHRCPSGIFSLKKVNTYVKGKMGVWGWVKELKRDNKFEVQSYKKLGDTSNVTQFADKVVPGMHYVSKRDDLKEAGTGIVFYIKKSSKGEDYQKAVEACKAIINVACAPRSILGIRD